LRLLAPLYSEAAHFLVGEGKAGASLAGARLAVGRPGSRGEHVFRQLVSAVDIGDGEPVRLHYLGLDEAVEHYRLGWIDGLFHLAPVPLLGVLEEEARPRLTL